MMLDMFHSNYLEPNKRVFQRGDLLNGKGEGCAVNEGSKWLIFMKIYFATLIFDLFSDASYFYFDIFEPGFPVFTVNFPFL